jgi:hypothetical protein
MEGNDEEQGSAFGEVTDSPVTAVEREGYEVLAIHEDGSALAHSKHKHYYYVRLENGPWGVDVSTTVRRICGDELSAHA